MIGLMNQNLVDPTIEYGYYTGNQIFGWPNIIFHTLFFTILQYKIYKEMKCYKNTGVAR